MYKSNSGSGINLNCFFVLIQYLASKKW